MNTKLIKGWQLALVAAVISGTANFANGLVVKGIDPMVHTTVKNAVVGLLILGVLGFTQEWKQIKTLTRKQLTQLGLVGLIGGSIPFALFFTGLKMIGGLQGSIIHKTLIFWVALMAVPLLKEKVSQKMMLGVGLLYLSNFMLGFGGFSNLGLGHLLVLAATIFWAVENIIAKKVLVDVPVNLVVAARMVLGTVILIGMSGAMGKLPLVMSLSGRQWMLLAVVGLLLFGFVMSWYKALQLAPATQVASILVVATPVASLLTAVNSGSMVSMAFVGQSLLILTGIWLVTMAALDVRQKAWR